ncbi:MAG: LemA family protein [Saprospiraceae bacterium]|jgi:LemA protein
MKSIYVALILVVFGLMIGVGGCNNYNAFIELDENVAQAWGEVQTNYQRRSDLIGNLVETVKGAANFEQETLTGIAEARAKATSINIDPSNLSADQLQAFENAQAGLSQSLGRLLVSVEKYPELKANQNFLELQSQLEGTENRISVSRTRYNEAVTSYNKKIRRFPSSIYASVLGFERETAFTASEAAQSAPQVKF